VAGGADPLRVGLSAFEAWFGRPSAPFSWAKRGLQLRRALARGDRYGDPAGGRQAGLGISMFLDLLEGLADYERGGVADAERLETLAGAIVTFDRQTRDARHAARHAAGECAAAGGCRYEHTYHPPQGGRP